jgi:P-type conjugative transfer protein TrbJ
MWQRVVLGLAVWLLSSAPAWAQFAVEDVYVGVQTAISALNSARELVQQGIQIGHEVEMIKNQIEQLAYDAANLTKSPLQLVGNLQQLMGRYETLLRQAGGLGFEVQGMDGRLGTLYPVFGQPVRDVQGGMQQLRAWLGEIRHASFSAMGTQAVIDRLELQRAHLNTALLHSEAAPGQLAVIQNGNQILGIIVEQNASALQLHAASARAQTVYLMQQAAAADQAMQEAEQRVSTIGAMEDIQSIGIPQFR